jgi:hypothetical protein
LPKSGSATFPLLHPLDDVVGDKAASLSSRDPAREQFVISRVHMPHVGMNR